MAEVRREIERLPAISLERYQRLVAIVEVRHGRARSDVNERRWCVPEEASAFPDAVEELHGLIFPNEPEADPREPHVTRGGSFRLDGDPGVQFGAHPNIFRGCDPRAIAPRLVRLYERTIAGKFSVGQPREFVVASLAPFLSEFFRIHPFHDGNGRVARLVCLALLTAAGHPSVFGGGSASKYTSALTRAHRSVDGVDFRREKLDALRMWLRSGLRPFDPNPVEEEPSSFTVGESEIGGPGRVPP